MISAPWPRETAIPSARRPAHGRALGDVAALDPVAEVVHDLGDAAHADPADADEMDRADGEGHRLHAAPPAPAGAGCAAEPPIRPSTRIRQRARRIGPGETAGSGRAPREFGRLRHERLQLPSEPVRRERRLRDHDRRAGRDQGAAVRALVIVRSDGERHQDRRPPRRRKLGDGRCAGPADHDVRLAEPRRHVLEEGREPRRHPLPRRKRARPPPGPRGRHCWLSSIRCRRASGSACHGRRHDLGEDAGALAPARDPAGGTRPVRCGWGRTAYPAAPRWRRAPGCPRGVTRPARLSGIRSVSGKDVAIADARRASIRFGAAEYRILLVQHARNAEPPARHQRRHRRVAAEADGGGRANPAQHARDACMTARARARGLR